MYTVLRNVIPEIYDHQLFDEMFDYDDGDMKINTDIDMNNHKITNLKDPENNSDVVNKYYLSQNSFNHTIYANIFTEAFFDFTDTSKFILSNTASGIIIQNILGSTITPVKPIFSFNEVLFINNYDPKDGLVFYRSSKVNYIQLSKVFNQNTSFTIFISFNLIPGKTGIDFGFFKNRVKFLPHYRVAPHLKEIEMFFDEMNFNSVNLPDDAFNKQMFLSVCFDGTNIYKMAFSNNSSHVSQIRNPPQNFTSEYFMLRSNIPINKIGIVDRFININSLEHHKIMLEEKRNGSYLFNV